MKKFLFLIIFFLLVIGMIFLYVWTSGTGNISMRRWACEGSCPDYEITISSDGKATKKYPGGRIEEYSINPIQFKKLVFYFKISKFLIFPNNNNKISLDTFSGPFGGGIIAADAGQKTTLIFNINGREKEVNFSTSGEHEYLDEFQYLSNKVDTVYTESIK